MLYLLSAIRSALALARSKFRAAPTKPVNLVGHSYGANCALEASLLTGGLRRLVLYEPAIEWTNPQGYLERHTGR